MSAFAGAGGEGKGDDGPAPPAMMKMLFRDKTGSHLVAGPTGEDTGAAMAPGEVLMSDERMRSTFSPDGRFQAVYDEDSDNVTIFDTE
eukprot:g5051.t1